MRKREPVEGGLKLRSIGQGSGKLGGHLNLPRCVIGLDLHGHGLPECCPGGLPGGLVHTQAGPASADRHRRAAEFHAVQPSAHPEPCAAERRDNFGGQVDERSAAAAMFKHSLEPLLSHSAQCSCEHGHVDLDTVAGELYGLPPEEFTSARDARAGEARKAGDRELAAAIKKLRRPTAAAWLANLLVRERGEQISGLLDLGGQMRQAQADLAGNDLRRLSQQRRQVVAALVDDARHLAGGRGRPLSEATARELEATLDAAIADAGAAAELRRGRLAAALRYSGFGPVDLTGSTAAPAGPARETAATTARERPPVKAERAVKGEPVKQERPQTDRRSRERRHAAQRELRAAEAAATAAEREVAKLEGRLRGARTERDRLRQQAADLERRLRDLRDAEEQAGRDLLDAEEARDAADLEFRGALDRVARARSALDRPAPPPS